MTRSKYFLTPTLATSLLVLAGCTTQTTTNTLPVQTGNVVTNTNTNTNATVSNENTNTSEESGETSESEWLTYNNNVHGFSVSYPSDWRVETGRDEDNEPILDDTDTGFFVTYALPAWKHQDFTPGISIIFETDENFSELKKKLEKDNQGSNETKMDGYSAIAYNQLEIVYEQVTLIPKKNIIIRTRVDENYSMSGTFEGIYNSIKLD